jgi:transposase
MLALNITQSDIELLRYERYDYPSRLVQKRLHVIYLKAITNHSHQAIGKIVGVHPDTITDYIHTYNEFGLDALYRVGYGTNRSELDKYEESLIEYFEKNPPISSMEARKEIKRLTGLERSPSQIRCWLHKHGFEFRKTGQIPSKAKPEKQDEFIEQTLNPLIERAKEEEIHLLFMDAAHFVMGVFLTVLWSIKRRFVKSSSGRKRYNVLGAVDAISKKVHTYTNEGYINAQCVIDFLEQIRAYYNDRKPIYIVLDNARYQRCQLVEYMAWFLDVHLVFLPAYSPNLNIIERLWKWTKGKCLYAKFYETFQDFKSSIDNTLEAANKEYQHELESLLTLKFQRF